MEASDCFLYFLPEELREFEVCFFSLLPFREVRRSAMVVTFFFGSRGVSTSDRQSGQVCLFRGSRLLAIEVIKVSVPLLKS
jgi:hypothetical protein